MARKEHHMMTKDEIKRIASMWETHTVQQIADIIGTSTASIYNVARIMTEAGYKITYKKVRGSLNHLILEAIDEL